MPQSRRTSSTDRRRRRAEAENQEETFIALPLMLASVGPDAVRFLQTMIRDRSLDPAVRSLALDEIGPNDLSLFWLISIRRLPLDDPLGSTAR